ncbi:MAG: hypothetical protein EZS28_000523 [Streblomastix strix]|uniref:Uncharacterized protein n=1 Tax=Streblomastix strix TaxID=222440 RepID=A0A5J4XA03_9EUKA|nr:MAG: hypothetical protein EZS28_000523 [Streblomastix strix]
MLPGLFPSSKNAISAISACWDYDGFSQMEMQDHRLIPPRIPLLITQLHAPATRERAFQELFELYQIPPFDRFLAPFLWHSTGTIRIILDELALLNTALQAALQGQKVSQETLQRINRALRVFFVLINNAETCALLAKSQIPRFFAQLLYYYIHNCVGKGHSVPQECWELVWKVAELFNSFSLKADPHVLKMLYEHDILTTFCLILQRDKDKGRMICLIMMNNMLNLEGELQGIELLEHGPDGASNSIRRREATDQILRTLLTLLDSIVSAGVGIQTDQGAGINQPNQPPQLNNPSHIPPAFDERALRYIMKCMYQICANILSAESERLDRGEREERTMASAVCLTIFANPSVVILLGQSKGRTTFEEREKIQFVPATTYSINLLKNALIQLNQKEKSQTFQVSRSQLQ